MDGKLIRLEIEPIYIIEKWELQAAMYSSQDFIMVKKITFLEGIRYGKYLGGSFKCGISHILLGVYW